MNEARKWIYGIVDQNGDTKSNIYDAFMLIIIIISIIPLAFKHTNRIFIIVDDAAAIIFLIDYLARWITADMKSGDARAFLYYPITPMAIIDLLAILPLFNAVAAGFRLFKLFRLMRTLRVFRAIKIVRYSKNIAMLINVFKKQRRALICVGTLAVAYIIISALIIFNVEPDSFDTYFEAVYWATVSLTTMGYGDIYPVTTMGRAVTMISSIFGIAIVALPSSIITAGYITELNKGNMDEETQG